MSSKVKVTAQTTYSKKAYFRKHIERHFAAEDHLIIIFLPPLTIGYVIGSASVR